MKDECLICGAPLEYLDQDVRMECSICHKIEYSKTRCIKGHYVCNQCHMSGMDAIGTVGGPRCCKRDSFLSIIEAVKFADEQFGIKMETGPILCDYSPHNNQCIGVKCPFFKK